MTTFRGVFFFFLICTVNEQYKLETDNSYLFPSVQKFVSRRKTFESRTAYLCPVCLILEAEPILYQKLYFFA